MPGHLLLYHPAVKTLKTLVDAGELGDVLCVYSNRQNLGDDPQATRTRCSRSASTTSR